MGRAYIDLSNVIAEPNKEFEFIVDIREEAVQRYVCVWACVCKSVCFGWCVQGSAIWPIYRRSAHMLDGK